MRPTRRPPPPGSVADVRIAIDVRELDGQRTGVGRYLWQLLLAWNEMPAATAHDFITCSPVAHDLSQALPNLRLTARHLPRFRGTFWEQLSLPLLTRDANVLFAPAYTGPMVGRTPTV